MNRGRPHETDFGPLEKTVRWIEETPAERFRGELSRRLAKAGDADALLRAAALASMRSVRFEGLGHVPHGLLVLSSVRSLQGLGDPDTARHALEAALCLVYDEIRDPGFGPYRLLEFQEVAADGREGTLFAFLEAVRAGEVDWADHRFAWLVRNLEKDQVIDLLLSSGLESVTSGAHKVIGVVELSALVQALGWDLAPHLFRPIVRHQASGGARLEEYDHCRELAATRDLLRVAKRRPPGHPALGERDPEAFLQAAISWAESEPRARSLQVAEHLVAGIPLEDAADMIAIGASLLLLQETLKGIDTAMNPEETDRRAHLVTGVLGMRQLVRLGTPGQRILGLLLAGWVGPAAGVRLDARDPDSGWWLPPATRLLEPAEIADSECAPVPATWQELILTGQANGLLPLLTARLESGATASALDRVLVARAARLEVFPCLAVKLERALSDAYRSSRTPHRWLHRWAAALALTMWPQERRTGDLHGKTAAATIPA